jgi:hypothetical protein
LWAGSDALAIRPAQSFWRLSSFSSEAPSRIGSAYCGGIGTENYWGRP